MRSIMTNDTKVAALFAIMLVAGAPLRASCGDPQGSAIEAPAKDATAPATAPATDAATPAVDAGAAAADAEPSAEEKVNAKGLEIGNAAPEFTLLDLDGKSVSLSEKLKTGPVLLDFWALWCKPCLKSLPATEQIKKDYAGRGLTVIAVNTDSPRTSAKVKPYVKSSGFTFDVLMDPNNTLQRLYRFYRIPQLFLISQDGKIAYSHLGYVPGAEKEVVAAIEKLYAGAGKASGGAGE
jgi:peroxiredoxin